MVEETDYVYLNKFIWNKEKAQINKQKHKVSFETAALVFNDSSLLVEFDERNSSIDEDRYNCIGLINGVYFLFVTMTERNDLIRIISARRAEKDEIRKYEQNAKNI